MDVRYSRKYHQITKKKKSSHNHIKICGSFSGDFDLQVTLIHSSTSQKQRFSRVDRNRDPGHRACISRLSSVLLAICIRVHLPSAEFQTSVAPNVPAFSSMPHWHGRGFDVIVPRQCYAWPACDFARCCMASPMLGAIKRRDGDNSSLGDFVELRVRQWVTCRC